MIESLSFRSMSVSPSPVLQIMSKSHIPSPDYCVTRHCDPGPTSPHPRLSTASPAQSPALRNKLPPATAAASDCRGMFS